MSVSKEMLDGMMNAPESLNMSPTRSSILASLIFSLHDTLCFGRFCAAAIIVPMQRTGSHHPLIVWPVSGEKKLVISINSQRAPKDANKDATARRAEKT